MQVFPARNTVHLALAALGTMTVALALRLPAAFAWSAAMIGALAIARAATQLAVLRLRRAGLEMVWRTTERVRRVPRLSQVTILAELKNRDVRPVQFGALRLLASRELLVTCLPVEGEIPAGGSVSIVTTVNAPRVGHFCLQGLAMEVRAARGSFEVPLAFANPIGVLVIPRAFSGISALARGGPSRPRSEPGAPHLRPGPGSELHDLREHVSGDAFKHIAWKATARRGRLMVREYQREDREVVWLVLDAAVEHQSGQVGHAPIDAGIDDMAALARGHLRRGDYLGLAVSGCDPRSWVAPARGAHHAQKLADALAAATSTAGADRSEDDEAEVARKVLDHLRFLDAASVGELRVEQLDGVHAHAEMKRPRAPYDLLAPAGSSARERALRRYLLCFGIATPPRLEHDRTRAASLLLQAVARAAQEKPRPTLVYVWSPASDLPESLAATLAKLKRRGMAVRWISPPVDRRQQVTADEVTAIIEEAVATRAQLSRARGEQRLRAMGALVQHRVRTR